MLRMIYDNALVKNTRLVCLEIQYLKLRNKPWLPFCHPQSLLPAVFLTRSNWFPTPCKSQEVSQQHPTPAVTKERYWNQPVSLACSNLWHTHTAPLDFYYITFVSLLVHVRNKQTKMKTDKPVRPFCQPCITLGQSLFRHLKITIEKMLQNRWGSRACHTWGDLECNHAQIQVWRQNQRIFFLPISPPGTAYWRSFCSANRDTIRENMARHCNLPSLSFETIPGRTSISWLTYRNKTKQNKRY